MAITPIEDFTILKAPMICPTGDPFIQEIRVIRLTGSPGDLGVIEATPGSALSSVCLKYTSHVVECLDGGGSFH
ncbi:hypothetical protein RRG08_043044 [Elysia crispata]|uniref:Uncharacterized protein n=1 Tax=Elysia crispata TaxID=231223 RepID=A0AAE0XXY9_9GAST|nr:hypothetical protein RRG08_043044 [Elysia crispata]